MAECKKCIHNAVCKTADSCDGFVSGCKHFKEGWISVKERLPEQTDPATAVLGITKQGKCYVVYYYKATINDEFTGFYDNAVKRAVTHWMPLPQTPKGE